MSDTFELAGRTLTYQRSDYNGTRFNERAVEVPVGLALLERATRQQASILEVGAVLPHYGANSHTVIDLYEDYPAVINANVLTWEPPQKFDLIISISTLDHLCNEGEFIYALARLYSWLAPGGLLYVTLPYGQPAWVGGGPWIDDFLLGENNAATVWRMDKVDVINQRWAQVDDLTGCPLGAPLAYHGQSPAANSVYFLLWGDVEGWWHG